MLLLLVTAAAAIAAEVERRWCGCRRLLGRQIELLLLLLVRHLLRWLLLLLARHAIIRVVHMTTGRLLCRWRLSVLCLRLCDLFEGSRSRSLLQPRV